jgi:hypothetical protein
MNKLPTDRYLLASIFDMYQSTYPGPKKAEGGGENGPYLSIDIPALAKKLECTPELLFGRLYYHLDQKYRYKQDNGSIVPLFYLKVGDKRHAVHFPYLASILAGQNQEFRKYIVSLCVSFFALAVSVTSLAVSLMKHAQ